MSSSHSNFSAVRLSPGCFSTCAHSICWPWDPSFYPPHLFVTRLTDGQAQVKSSTVPTVPRTSPFWTRTHPDAPACITWSLPPTCMTLGKCSRWAPRHGCMSACRRWKEENARLVLVACYILFDHIYDSCSGVNYMFSWCKLIVSFCSTWKSSNLPYIELICYF
jgi:hypothetical protein